MPRMNSEYPAGHQKKQILKVIQGNCEVFHRKTYFT